MGAKWSTVSTSTYADGSPSDDGSATEANKVKYTTIKTDLTDPLDTAIDSIVSKLDQRFTETTTSVSTDYTTVASDHAKILEVTDGAITLLAAATGGASYRVGVYSSGQATTVSRSSTDTIDGATSVTVTDKTLAWFAVNAAGDGYVSNQGTEVSGLTADSTPDKAADYVLAYDASAGTNKKVLIGVAGGPVFMPVQTLNGVRNRTFSSIPAWATRITINVWSLSTGGTTDAAYIRLGDAGGMESADYLGSVASASGSVLVVHSTAFQINNSTSAASAYHGRIVLELADPDTYTWTITGHLSRSDAGDAYDCSGSKALSAALTQVQFGLFGSTDTCDAGSVSGYYE